jgi:hypothetical protein
VAATIVMVLVKVLARSLEACPSTPWPPLLGDDKERSEAAPFYTPRWVARASQSLPLIHKRPYPRLSFVLRPNAIMASLDRRSMT